MSAGRTKSKSVVREDLAVLFQAAGSVRAATQLAAEKMLSTCSGGEWLQLDDFARGSDWEVGVVVGRERWAVTDSDSSSGISAAAMSLHRGGRVRQLAVRVLGGLRGRIPAAALAVRCLDHAWQVRNEALIYLSSLTDPVEAEIVLSVLRAAAFRANAGEALRIYSGSLLSTPGSADLLAVLRNSDDRSVRRWAFDLWFKNEELSVEDLLVVARAESDQAIRRWSVERICAQAPTEVLRELLRGRYAEGRLAAVVSLGDEGLSDDDLVALLLDSSARIRELAQLKAQRRGLDASKVYRSSVKSGRRTAPSLLGLAATGTADDLSLVTPCLVDPMPRVRAGTVAAVSVLAVVDRIDLLRPMLLDASPRVASAAVRALARAGARPETASAAWASAQVWSRRAAWRLCCSVGGWDRVESDLRAANDNDPELSSLGIVDVRNWLQHNAANTHSHLGLDQSVRIEILLSHAPLDGHLTRQIAFHAGLPWPLSV